MTPKRLRLRVNPDATLVGNSLIGSLAAPAGELAYRPHLFRLLLPGWAKARCVAANGRVLPRVEGGWLLRPGLYRLER